MSIRTQFWESVDSLRQLEATIVAAGEDGITIADLQPQTGLSRRTVDRNLAALRELGSGIVSDGAGGRVARRWMLQADQAVFRQGWRFGRRRGVR
jgi:biotin operon repressor